MPRWHVVTQVGAQVSAQIGAIVIALGCRSVALPLFAIAPEPAPEWPAPQDPVAQVMVQEAPAQEERADGAVVEPDPIALQREMNEIAFENAYLRQKERLFADHAGQWLAIVGARIWPSDERGRPAPAASFDDCMKSATAADPAALHRFVFRIGEEGDVVHADSSGAPRNVVGSALRAMLGIDAAFDAKQFAIRWTRGGKSKQFQLGIDRQQIELLLTDPGGRQSMGTLLADSAIFSGYLALESTFAALLDAHRFEIPGRVLLETPAGVSVLRRARVRLRVPELELDAIVPLAAWSR